MNKLDTLSDSESYDDKSLPSINEEEDSHVESTSPRAHIKKRSVTNLRFDFNPDIMIETSPKKDREDQPNEK